MTGVYTWNKRRSKQSCTLLQNDTNYAINWKKYCNKFKGGKISKTSKVVTCTKEIRFLWCRRGMTENGILLCRHEMTQNCFFFLKEQSKILEILFIFRSLLLLFLLFAFFSASWYRFFFLSYFPFHFSFPSTSSVVVF